MNFCFISTKHDSVIVNKRVQPHSIPDAIQLVGLEYLMRAFHAELFGGNTFLQLNQTRTRKSGEMENVRMNEKNKSGKKKSGKQLFEIPANEQFVADYLDELSFY